MTYFTVTSSDALQHMITEILKQELDGPIAMSLSERTKGLTDIDPLLNMIDDEIDDLHYYTRSSRNSATSEMKDRNKDYEFKATTRVGLKEDHKKLLKLFTSFVRSLRDENEKLPDWSNIDSEMFTNYCSSYGDVPNFTSERSRKSSSNTTTINHKSSNKLVINQSEKNLSNDESKLTKIKGNGESQGPCRDTSIQDEQPFVISRDQEFFDITTFNSLTEQQRNNKSIFCLTTEFRPKQQGDALSTKYFCGSEHVLKSTGADITVPLGNQFMDIRNLLPHYDNELFMGSIPPDKNITLHNSGQPSPTDLGSESITSSASPNEAPYHHIVNNIMISNYLHYVCGPTLKDLHAQIQDSTRRSYFFLQKSLRETHHHFKEVPLNPSMALHWSLKEDVKLLCQFDGSQPDPPLVSNMDKFLHDCTNSSPDSEDGEDNQPLKNFHRQLIHPPTLFNRLSNFCSGYDKLPFHGNSHGDQCSSSSTSPLQSNESPKDLIISKKHHKEKRYLTSVTYFRDDEKLSTCIIHKDNFSCPFDDMTSRDVSSITYLSSSEDPTFSLQPISETFPSNEFHIY